MSIFALTAAGKFAGHCGLTCLQGPDKRGCACVTRDDCEMQKHPDFGQRRLDAVDRHERAQQALFTTPGTVYAELVEFDRANAFAKPQTHELAAAIGRTLAKLKREGFLK